MSKLTGDLFDIEVAYAFEDLGQQTRVTQVSIVRPKGLFMKIMFKLMGTFAQSGGCKAAQKELNSLKRHLEHAGAKD